MAQFDLHRLGEGQGAGGALLVVDLQTDLIGLDATRIVAPLRAAGRYPALPGLTPEVRFGGRAWVVHVQDLAAVARSELGPAVGTLAGHRDELLRAIDILTHGF